MVAEEPASMAIFSVPGNLRHKIFCNNKLGTGKDLALCCFVSWNHSSTAADAAWMAWLGGRWMVSCQCHIVV